MKNIYFPDFSCTHGRMCVYGRYAPVRSFRPINTWFDELTFLISFLIKKQIVIYNEMNAKFPFKLRELREVTGPSPTTISLPKTALLNHSREIQKKSLFCLFVFFCAAAKHSQKNEGRRHLFKD